jgi:hypothetical protein
LKHGEVLVPREWMVYLGVERMMKRHMGTIEFWEQRAQAEARDVKNADIWGGLHVQGIDRKVGGKLMEESPRTKDSRTVYLRGGSLVEAGFDHFPVFGKGAKRYAPESLHSIQDDGIQVVSLHIIL